MNAGPAPRAGATPTVFDAERRALTLGLILTVTMVGFESLAVSTALPRIQEDLQGLALYGWVSAAYLLGHLVGIPAAGWIADRRGLALPFGGGLTLFAGGLALATVAPAMWVIVLARLLQGIGGGAIPAVAYVAAGRAYPPDLRPRVFAIMSTAWVLPGLVGPSVSAAVTEQLGWRWVFFGLLPLIPPAAAMALPSLHRLDRRAGDRTRPGGDAEEERRAEPGGEKRVGRAVALASGVALVLASASLPLVPGIAAAVAGAAIAARSYLGLAPPGTLRLAPGLPATIAMRAFQTFAFFGVDFFVPYAFNEVHGTSLGMAGLAVTAATFSWTAGAWISERVLARVGPRAQIRRGLMWLLAGNVLTAAVLWPGTATLVAALVGAVLAGLGIGLGYSVVSVTMLGYAEPGREGHTASSLSLTDVLGAALATGTGGALIALGADRGWHPRTGVLLAFALPTLVGAIGIAAASRLPTRVPERARPEGAREGRDSAREEGRNSAMASP
jgi:MFS family permease